jgi:hypothetical protein
MTPWRLFWPSICLIILACSISSTVAADVPLRAASGMVLESSATSLAGGKVRLTTTALRWKAGRYIGNYELKVFPYAFKNETGTLSIGVSEDALRKLSAGTPLSLTGIAQTSGTGKTRPVSVIATPAAGGVRKGTLTISITTKNGVMVFSPGYTLTGG